MVTFLLLQILFWLALFALLHTYLFYPIWLQLKGERLEPYLPPDVPEEDLPLVSILMSVYNEETVLEEKLESLLGLNYPSDKLRIWIGSDASSDQTNDLLKKWQPRLPGLTIQLFSERRGKPSVINDLALAAAQYWPIHSDHLFLLTDANVMLEPSTLYRLARHFQDPKIGLVDAHMVNTGVQSAGISRSEQTYISREVQVKHWEGRLWGTMIGPFGGCFLLRSSLFSAVPANYLVDDFYMAMRVFEQGGKAINDLEAYCYEQVPQEIQIEFRRKARISAGNFQNLATFRSLWWPPTGNLGFAFFSHKVLRWLGPFFLLVCLLASGLLASMGNLFFQGMFLLQAVLILGIPILDRLFQLLGVHALLLRGIRYFVMMNLALLVGFFRFLRGIRKGTWEPTKRS
jgi:cellulose synthase/poly-beta-1,6-N-acetylglucosamine synthase-like glycosyltransferase